MTTFIGALYYILAFLIPVREIVKRSAVLYRQGICMNHAQLENFRIGCCQIQPSALSIQFDDGEKQTLQPKFIEVIAYLARHYPRVIPRRELIETIWNGNDSVGEKALTNAVWHLRQTLKSADDEVIETIRKIGYRLLIAPEWLEENELGGNLPPDQAPTAAGERSVTKVLLQFVAYSLIVPCSVLLTWYYLTRYGQVDTPTIEQITREPGSEVNVAPSPDGRYIVYMWQSFGRHINLFMRDLWQPQMPVRQLTFDRARQRFSVWSNDRQYLYFHRKDTLRSVCDIIQMKVGTNQEQRIASCSLSAGFIYMDISPDDKILAYQGEQDNSSGIYFVALDNPDAEPVRFSCSVDCGYRDRDMAFSPDGLKIAVTRRVNSFNENIYLVDLATKEAEVLTEGEEDIVGLTWHPDGEKIVYATARADFRSGYVVDVHSKEIQSLDVGDFSYPAYSRQTAELFYERRATKSQILSLQLGNTIIRTPFPVVESEFSHHSPDYSVKADKITYVSNESGYFELWTADNDGRNRQQLTYLEKGVRDPRWSHGGDRVVFVGQAENSYDENIYITDTESKKLTIVPAGFRQYDRPSWSYDDSAIIAGVHDDNTRDIYQFEVDSGSAKRLTSDGGRFGVMISPKNLLYTRADKGLWQKDIESNSIPIKKIDDRFFSHPYAWTYDDGGVYFRQNKSDHHQIVHYDFNMQKLTTLVRLPKKTFRSYGTLSFLPQQGKLLYAGTQYPQADIKKLVHPRLP